MELKFDHISNHTASCNRFNRTFMELKSLCEVLQDEREEMF